MATAVDAAKAEIDAALVTIPTKHEGFRDFARLNLQPATLVEVRTSLEDYNRRVRLLEAAKVALDALVADGHPALLPRVISDAALEDLRDNAGSINAALEEFVGVTPAPPATRLNLSAGAVEPK